MVYCHILLVVHTCIYRCVYIIYLFAKMQQQAQENTVDIERCQYYLIFIFVFQPIRQM